MLLCDIRHVHATGVLQNQQGVGVSLDGDLELLNDLLCDFDARRHHEKEKPVSQGVFTGFEPDDVTVVGIGVAHPPDVRVLEAEERLAGGGKDDGDAAL